MSDFISPLDGRYQNKLKHLSSMVSENALNRFRIVVELRWIKTLLEEKLIKSQAPLAETLKKIKAIEEELSAKDLQRVKEIEAKINHDVKAVEYLVREKLQEKNIEKPIIALTHFACTSEDINNVSYALLLTEVRKNILMPDWQQILTQLQTFAMSYQDVSMMSRTHGQSASPTTLGKEFAVFYARLARQKANLEKQVLCAKFNGAVGNYNAHVVAKPEVDWRRLTKDFLAREFQLEQNPLTTQIENHDTMIEYCDTVKRFNSILIGLCRDIWSYISIGYFKLKKAEHEVGSSTMPHKVNPIDFENAEGNLGVANSLASHFSEKLLISRWQRDLSDSTVLRNLGSFFGYTSLACSSVSKGFAKLEPDTALIQQDLENHWEVLTEALQTLLRLQGAEDAYERLKELSRGRGFSITDYQQFITQEKSFTQQIKERLLALTPSTYTGYASDLAREGSLSLSATPHSRGQKP